MPLRVTVPVDPATVTFTEEELQKLTPTVGSAVVERLRSRQQSGRYTPPGTAPGPAVAKPQVVSKDEVIDID
jgi:hypothetical protein